MHICLGFVIFFGSATANASLNLLAKCPCVVTTIFLTVVAPILNKTVHTNQDLRPTLGGVSCKVETC
jgi:hypothetical protein